MTTAALIEKRYTLSFLCLVFAVFWAGMLVLSMHAFAHEQQSKTSPGATAVEKDA